MYVGIEAGGTKFNCIIAQHPGQVLGEKRITTGEPEKTVQEVVKFIRQTVDQDAHRLKAIGIGSFGPLDLNPASPDFGSITSTPKKGWGSFNIKKAFEDALEIPAVIDTDVNAAALGEFLWGAGQDRAHVLYLTIGTGIGGGIVVNGKPYHGMLHPEMGHILLPHEAHFKGICPYHGHCFEGLASGPALQARWGVEASRLEKGHPAWEEEARVIALALCNYICILSPDIIILGGGVMQQSHLFPLIRSHVREFLNGYVQADPIMKDINTFIVPPGSGTRSGMLGALALARQVT